MLSVLYRKGTSRLLEISVTIPKPGDDKLVPRPQVLASNFVRTGPETKIHRDLNILERQYQSTSVDRQVPNEEYFQYMSNAVFLLFNVQIKHWIYFEKWETWYTKDKKLSLVKTSCGSVIISTMENVFHWRAVTLIDQNTRLTRSSNYIWRNFGGGIMTLTTDLDFNALFPTIRQFVGVEYGILWKTLWVRILRFASMMSRYPWTLEARLFLRAVTSISQISSKCFYVRESGHCLLQKSGKRPVSE